MGNLFINFSTTCMIKFTLILLNILTPPKMNIKTETSKRFKKCVQILINPQSAKTQPIFSIRLKNI